MAACRRFVARIVTALRLRMKTPKSSQGLIAIYCTEMLFKHFK
jgi:hypothetical protein